MHSEINAPLAFHLTGIKSAEQLEPLESLGLRPALLAAYRDLAKLRYDFPLVLLAKPENGEFAQPLCALVDAALANIKDERVRTLALRKEREIRAQAEIESRTLAQLWTVAPPLGASGHVVDCDARLPVRFITAAWSAVQAEKARRFHEEAERLIVQLENILAAARAHSDQGRSAERLAASLAATDDSFDTQALSRLLSRALPERRLPHSRERRIGELLTTLTTQRFFSGGQGEERPYSFVFYSCGAARRALHERRKAAVELAQAMAAARLEVKGEYVEGVHDALLHAFVDGALDPALAPDYLVCINSQSLKVPAEASGLAELLESGLPVKILVQHDDLLEKRTALCAEARLVMGMALGLNDVFVLQTSASNLYPLRSRVLRGIEYPGTALFSVFSGGSGRIEGMPPYLVAAAAMESRVFPAFSYDPSARGERWERYSLENNPQPDADWVRHRLDFEDGEHQRSSEELAFTLTDFASLDARFAGYFAVARREKLNGADVPTLRMVDAENRLQTVIVAEPLARAAERCLDAWRGLQSLAKRPAAPVATAAAAPPPAAPAPAPASAPAAPEAAKVPAGDAPYIETPRCTTCEECVKINNRMFVYDANKQAFIADAKRGTYRELVEAAENCQVSIIHPGKPLNADEPGLDELLKRAEAFQ
ncbi:MAG TPA: hypothetical protein VFJ70_08185 [Burkholderiales bacterium]|nr:hypothetical protein [Burkholderiales bacterium]